MKFTTVRWLTAIVVGLIVFTISVLAVWRKSPDTLMNNTTIQAWSSSSMRSAHQFILGQIEQGHPPPASLDVVARKLKHTKFASRYSIVQDGVLVDGWGRPLHYSTDGTTYTLLSYGRDGKPGGEGFDLDTNGLPSGEHIPYSDESIYKDPPMPSLRRFLLELPSEGMIHGCALSGFLAALLTFFLIRPKSISGGQMVQLCMAIAITIAFAVLFATLIMKAHIPTTH